MLFRGLRSPRGSCHDLNPDGPVLLARATGLSGRVEGF